MVFFVRDQIPVHVNVVEKINYIHLQLNIQHQMDHRVKQQ